MAKSFIDYYLEESDKTYTYKIKLACDELDDTTLDNLERDLAKFDLLSMSAPTSTPYQSHPLDFPNVKNTKVFMVTVTVGYPASIEALRTLVAESTNKNISQVAVYTQNDPRNDASQMPEVQPVLGQDYVEEDATDYYLQAAADDAVDRASQRKNKRETTVVHNALSVESVTDQEGVAQKDVGETSGFSVLGGKQ